MEQTETPTNSSDAPSTDANYDIFNQVIPRLYRQGPFTEPILGLEIITGPWKGVVFYFKAFEVGKEPLENGLIPTRYETAILVRPETLPANWVPDAAFDAFTSEVVLAWLSYLNTNNIGSLVHAKTDGKLH